MDRNQCSVGDALLDPQHFLNFLPLPQGQGSFRPTFGPDLTIGVDSWIAGSSFSY